jgi:ABC-2 type transporter
MSSLVKTLNVFPKERTIVTRERAKRAYDVLPYFGSKLAAELPIGALFPLLFGSLVYPATGLNASASR